MEYIVKRCERRELPGVAHMYNQLSFELKEISKDAYSDFKEVSDHTMERILRNAIAECGLIIYVALEGEEVVGFISGSIKKSILPVSVNRQVGYIEGAYVQEDCRREHVMAMLEDALVEELKNRGVYYIELNVLQANETAKCAWEKRGYETFRKQMRKRI